MLPKMTRIMLAVVFAAAVGLGGARVRAGAATVPLLAERCGDVDVLDFTTSMKQNECPRYACPASLAAANPGNARDLPFAVCNLDALHVDGKVVQPAADTDGALPDKISGGDGHAFCAVGDDAGAIVQERCALHDWPAAGGTSIVVRLTRAVRAAVVCVVSLNKRGAARSLVRFTTSSSGDSASTTASWTTTTTNGRQCFSLMSTRAAFDTLHIANGDDASTDSLCVQRIDSDCDDGERCTRDYGESNPPPRAKPLEDPAPCDITRHLGASETRNADGSAGGAGSNAAGQLSNNWDSNVAFDDNCCNNQDQSIPTFPQLCAVDGTFVEVSGNTADSSPTTAYAFTKTLDVGAGEGYTITLNDDVTLLDIGISDLPGGSTLTVTLFNGGTGGTQVQQFTNTDLKLISASAPGMAPFDTVVITLATFTSDDDFRPFCLGPITATYVLQADCTALSENK